MKKYKRIISVLLAVLLTAISIPFAGAAPAVLDSGDCGKNEDNVKWTLYDDGCLVISGQGEMKDYDEYELITIPHTRTNENGEEEQFVEISSERIPAPWFQYNDKMNNCLIQSGVTRIGSYAFYDCDGLTSVEIPSTVTKIDGWAFFGCTGLISVEIPPTVTEIGSYAFARCNGLDSIHVPASVTSIEAGAFRWCKNLKFIFVDESNPVYSSDLLGCLYNKDKSVFIQYPLGNPRTRFAIPDSVTEISYNAFQGSVYLTSVSFGRNLEHFEGYTFADCDALVSVAFPDNIKRFHAYAFWGCSNLTTVTLGRGMQSIDWYALSWCKNLTTVIIPRNITKVSACAFIYTENIKDVYYSGSEEEWANVEIEEHENQGLLNATMHYNYEYDDHVHIYDPTVLMPACTTVGKIEFKCTCGDSYVEELYLDPANHVHTEEKDEIPSNCTEAGYTAGVYCNDCKTWITGHEIIEINPRFGAGTSFSCEAGCDIVRCAVQIADHQSCLIGIVCLYPLPRAQ